MKCRSINVQSIYRLIYLGIRSQDLSPKTSLSRLCFNSHLKEFVCLFVFGKGVVVLLVLSLLSCVVAVEL